jgi:hypothetical protein
MSRIDKLRIQQECRSDMQLAFSGDSRRLSSRPIEWLSRRAREESILFIDSHFQKMLRKALQMQMQRYYLRAQ